MLSLNVNGLKSKLDTGLLDLYSKIFDIICLTETKTDTPDLLNTYLSEYKCHSIQKSSNKQQYGGFHGMCILMKNSIFECSTRIQPTLSESVIWVKVGSELLGFPFILGAIYLPCEGSIHYSHEVFDDLCNDIVDIKSKHNAPFCLLGDFNARTGMLDDFLDVDDFVDQSSLGACDGDLDMYDTDIFNSRSNNDTVVNNNGKKVIEMCQSFDLRIVNGRAGSDHTIGKYTCFNKNGGRSTVDYAMSKRLFPLVKDFNVDIFDRCLSDVHCPIMLTLQSEDILNSDSLRNESREARTGPDKSNYLAFQWNSNSMLDFKQHTKDYSEVMHKYVDQLEADVNQEGIDIFYSHLCDMFLSTAKEVGVCKLKHHKKDGSKSGNSQSKQSQQPWFDTECRDARKEYLKVKNRWKRKVKLMSNSDVPVDSSNYDGAGKSYRNLLRCKKCKKRLYFQDLNKSLRSLRTKKLKEYWQLLNGKNERKEKDIGNVSLKDFFIHFSRLSYKEVDEPEPPIVMQELSQENVCLDVPITLKEVDMMINVVIATCSLTESANTD